MNTTERKEMRKNYEEILEILRDEVETQIAFIDSEIATALPKQELFGMKMARESMCITLNLLRNRDVRAYWRDIGRVNTGDTYFLEQYK